MQGESVIAALRFRLVATPAGGPERPTDGLRTVDALLMLAIKCLRPRSTNGATAGVAPNASGNPCLSCVTRRLQWGRAIFEGALDLFPQISVVFVTVNRYRVLNGGLQEFSIGIGADCD
jgi:hypothetical protein